MRVISSTGLTLEPSTYPWRMLLTVRSSAGSTGLSGMTDELSKRPLQQVRASNREGLLEDWRGANDCNR